MIDIIIKIVVYTALGLLTIALLSLIVTVVIITIKALLFNLGVI